MSVRATVWAWEQDVQANTLLVLLAVADEADDAGTYQAGAQVELMVKTGLSERALRDNLARLEDEKLLSKHPRFEGGRRVSDVLKLGVDGTLSLPAEIAAGEEQPAKSAGGDLGAKSHRQNLPGASSSTGPKGSGGSRSARRNLPLVSGEVSEALLVDAQALLDQRVRVGARIVTPEEMAIAVAALAEFNRHAEHDHGLGAALRGLVGRARDRPSFDADAHVRLVQSAWRVRWWERNGSGRRPSPAVIYGNAEVFEQVVQDAVDEKAGRKPGETKKPAKRFVREGPPRIGVNDGR